VPPSIRLRLTARLRVCVSECAQDFQYMTGVQQSFGATTQANTPWYWTEADWQVRIAHTSVAPQPCNTPALPSSSHDLQYEFVQHIASLPDSGVPSVFSISWGWYEGDQVRDARRSGACGRPVPMHRFRVRVRSAPWTPARAPAPAAAA